MTGILQEVQNKYSYLDNLLSKFWKPLLKSNATLKLHLKNGKWRNSKAKPGCAYIPTDVEQFANVVTHGIGIIPSVFATMTLFSRSNTYSQYLVACIYGGALIMLFCISTFFHCSCYCVHKSGLRNFLHRCDRAMIYVFIAGSYFPWLQLENQSSSWLLLYLEWMIWVLAAVGIFYQQVFHERYKCLETCFYICMGLVPAIVVLISGHEFHGLTELKLGGLLYVVGICFFKSDGIVPLAHAIWHIFVVLAASVHYFAILFNLFPKEVLTDTFKK